MRIIAYAVVFLALAVGGGSLVLFVVFLLGGPVPQVPLARSESGRLAWDVALSALFFVQHSGMIRHRVQSRLAAFVPADYERAAYAIASGAALLLVVVLWQPSEVVYYRLEGGWRWLSWAAALLAFAGLAWGVSSLGGFDALGVRAIRRRLRGERPQPAEFVVRGAYRYVRHPLYLFVLILIWSAPQMTADRLLFNILWTAWIVIGARLEERDLVGEFGDAYRDYQRRVPMLLPWPRPRASSV